MENTDMKQIQWFPGHMAKTRRLIAANLKLVDAVAEIVDARAPLSSRNPEMNSLTRGKPRIVLLNKCDLADEKATQMWINYFRKTGAEAIAVDCKSGRGIKNFLPTVKTKVLKELMDKRERSGMIGANIRLMIVGIPNVGKSSLINRLAGGKRARVEDRPGVTRTKQWVKLDTNTELLDMPGVLWPKFEDKLVGERLAFTGAVKDDIMDMEYLACRLLEFLKENYPELIEKRYGIRTDDIEPADEETIGCVVGFELLERIGRKRGFLVSGGEINTERAAITVMDEFRNGTLGRLTLEKPKGY